MARPTKCRRVSRIPKRDSFYCANCPAARQAVQMTVDEYETIRLIDLDGLTQEECAQQMSVARTTIQRIYESARHKLAMFLVEDCSLMIQGGNYSLCPEGSCTPCCRRRGGKACKGSHCMVREKASCEQS